MSARTVVSLITGLEDSERVTVALLVAVGAAEAGRETLMFLTKEAVRLVLDGYAVGVACDGCPPLPGLMQRYTVAGGKFLVCPICFTARELDAASMVGNAALGGTVQLSEWISDQPVVTSATEDQVCAVATIKSVNWSGLGCGGRVGG